MRAIIITLLACVFATGCTTLGEVPPPVTVQGATCEIIMAKPEAGKPAPAASPARTLCRELEQITAQSKLYSDGYAAVKKARATVQGVALVGAVAGAGFVTFEAHPDNAKAAGLTTGTMTLLNNGLRLNERSDVLRDGVASMNCYAGVGNRFVDAYQIGGAADNVTSVFDQLGVTIGRAESRAKNVKPANAEERAALLDVIKRARASYDLLNPARLAIARIPHYLARSWTDADGLLAERMNGLRPNMSDLIKQAQDLSKALQEKPAEPKKPADGGPAPQGGPAPVTDASLTEELEDLIAQAANLDAEDFVTSFERLAVCKAMAAN